MKYAETSLPKERVQKHAEAQEDAKPLPKNIIDEENAGVFACDKNTLRKVGECPLFDDAISKKESDNEYRKNTFFFIHSPKAITDARGAPDR